MINERTRKHRDKTSYKMMMAIFDQRSPHHKSKFAATPAKKPHYNAPKQKSKLSRSSRLMKLGKVLKKRLLQS